MTDRLCLYLRRCGESGEIEHESAGDCCHLQLKPGQVSSRARPKIVSIPGCSRLKVYRSKGACFLISHDGEHVRKLKKNFDQDKLDHILFSRPNSLDVRMYRREQFGSGSGRVTEIWMRC